MGCRVRRPRRPSAGPLSSPRAQGRQGEADLSPQGPGCPEVLWSSGGCAQTARGELSQLKPETLSTLAWPHLRLDAPGCVCARPPGPGRARAWDKRDCSWTRSAARLGVPGQGRLLTAPWAVPWGSMLQLIGRSCNCHGKREGRGGSHRAPPVSSQVPAASAPSPGDSKALRHGQGSCLGLPPASRPGTRAPRRFQPLPPPSWVVRVCVGAGGVVNGRGRSGCHWPPRQDFGGGGRREAGPTA